MKHYHCPVNGWDCPYYKDEPNHPCVCTMEKPYEECDDFIGMYDALAEGIGKIDPEDYTDDHEIITLYCPSCGGAIIENDCYDISIEQGKVIREMYGECESCEAEYTYLEEYALIEKTDLKVI